MAFKHMMILAGLLFCSALSAQTMAEKLFLTIPSSVNASVEIIDFAQFSGTPAALREVLDFTDADDILEDLRLDNSEIAGISMSKAEQGRHDAKFCTIVLKEKQAETMLNNFEKYLQEKGKKYKREGMTLSVGQEKVYNVSAPDTLSYAKIERGMKLSVENGNSMIPAKLKERENLAMYCKKVDNDAQWAIAVFRQQDVFFVKAVYKTTKLNKQRKNIDKAARKIGDAKFADRFAPLFTSKDQSVTVTSTDAEMKYVLEALEWDDDDD